MRSFVKITPSQNGEITLSLLMEVNHALDANFIVTNMSFNAICENKILPKISEFTVTIGSFSTAATHLHNEQSTFALLFYKKFI